MFSVCLFFAFISSTVGSPFPESSTGLDDLGSASSNTVGWDVFNSDTLSAVKEVPNIDTSQAFSPASSPDDSLFADDPPDHSGLDSLDLTISPNLPSSLANSEEGVDDNLFGTTNLGESFDLATNPPTGATGSCRAEVIQSGKRKRLLCPDPNANTDTETDTETGPDIDPQTESHVTNQAPTLGDESSGLPGVDQPGLLSKNICVPAFEAVCCTGQEYFGLLQTGCSKYLVSDFNNLDCFDPTKILCCINFDPDARTASSCYSPQRDPTAYPLRKLPDFPLNSWNDFTFEQPN